MNQLYYHAEKHSVRTCVGTKLAYSSCDISLYACIMEVTPKLMKNFKIFSSYLNLNPFAFILQFFLFLWNRTIFNCIFYIFSVRITYNKRFEMFMVTIWRRTEMALTSSVLQTVAVFIWYLTLRLHLAARCLCLSVACTAHCINILMTGHACFISIWLISWEGFMSQYRKHAVREALWCVQSSWYFTMLNVMLPN
jgi:hypothetical protein